MIAQSAHGEPEMINHVYGSARLCNVTRETSIIPNAPVFFAVVKLNIDAARVVFLARNNQSSVVPDEETPRIVQGRGGWLEGVL